MTNTTEAQPPGPGRFGRWLREPLLHFLLIGAGLFGIYHLLNGGGTGAPDEIVVTEARVEALAENFAKTWMRPPTAQELKGLVDDYVAEEVYYREGVAMGLDRDDTIIRRRLRQKMEFMSSDVAAAVEATDADLTAYLAGHADRFVNPPRITFQQVLFSVERRGESARRDAERLLADLAAGRGPRDPGEAGDPTLLPHVVESASPQDVANIFGTGFASQVEEAPVGQWVGPLDSEYGLHLVHVGAREAGSMPTLAEIRPLVLREWQAEQTKKAGEAMLAQMSSKYEIRIEGPLGEALRKAQSGQQKERAP